MIRYHFLLVVILLTTGCMNPVVMGYDAAHHPAAPAAPAMPVAYAPQPIYGAQDVVVAGSMAVMQPEVVVATPRGLMKARLHHAIEGCAFPFAIHNSTRWSLTVWVDENQLIINAGGGQSLEVPPDTYVYMCLPDGGRHTIGGEVIGDNLGDRRKVGDWEVLTRPEYPRRSIHEEDVTRLP
jgi:hypothetical protein